MLAPIIGIGQETEAKKPLFLPKSPVAAAYVLARLSNKDLIEAPRSEFVYVALAERPGLDRKYRVEALDGLAKARNTDVITEAVERILALDKKGEEAASALKEIVGILLQKPASDLLNKREVISRLTSESATSLGRQGGFAALISADASIDKLLSATESDSNLKSDVVTSVALVRTATLRSSFFQRIRPMADATDREQVRRAALVALASMPGHEAEVFTLLSGLVRSGTERSTAVSNLLKIPRKSWVLGELQTLLTSLLTYLKGVTPEQRTGTESLEAYQLASDVVAALPKGPEATAAAKELRSVGVSVFVIRTIHEQMIYDKLHLVVEAGKPVEIVLINEDAMPHNLVIVTPGSAEEIGKAGEKMAPEPDAQGRIHVPASDKVLFATRMINGGEQTKLSFTAPTTSGDYPYICTFPGHWMRMMGKMSVVPDVEAYLASQPAIAEPKITEWKLSDFTDDLPKVSSSRNLAEGKVQFAKLACVQCHKLGTDGYAFGPDLTDVLGRFKQDRSAILNEILDPSKVISERYKNFSLELKDGEELTGMLVKEDAEHYWIQTGPSDALIQQVKKSTVATKTVQSSSMMPVGLLNMLTKDQVLDLLSYIEAGGKAHDHKH